MNLAKQLQTNRKLFLSLATLCMLWLSPPGLANFSTCVSPGSDSDGDGWGWENNQSCLMPFVPNSVGWPGCTEGDSDLDGDGYGWENSQTCVVTILTPGRQLPVCQNATSDPDGDGWGWESNQSCIVESAPDTAAALPDYPTCLNSDSDPDNDGWGWENENTCIVDNTAPEDIPETAAALPGYPTCLLSNSDPDNDGWGWENGTTCAVSNDDNEEPANITFTETGQPICLSAASDSDGTGYGYEFNQSCQVVAGVTKTADDPLLNTELCYNWAEIAYGNYRIQNNTWNDSAVYSDRWSQCIELQQNSAGDPVPIWNFDWLGRSEGNLDQVKSYPQVYYGRKNARNLTGTPEETGLPRPLDQLDRYQIDYAFSTTGDAEYNVALESFFHSSCDVGDDNKQFEMMVWVGIPGEKTPGTQITTATIDGTTWKVYANPILTWGYVAFVAEETTPSGQLDWNAFIDWSRENSSSLGLGSMDNTCMGAIELGTETFWGELEFRLDRFDITRY